MLFRSQVTIVWLDFSLQQNLGSLVQMVKNLPAMQETWVQSLDWEGPLEKEMATHSGILAWEIPWTEEPGGIQSMGSQESDTTYLVTTPPPPPPPHFLTNLQARSLKLWYEQG